jgi:hypothetical protein
MGIKFHRGFESRPLRAAWRAAVSAAQGRSPTTDLERGQAKREVEEQDRRVRRVSRADREKMLRGGTIKDAASIAAYGLLLLSERPDGWTASFRSADSAWRATR